MESSGPAHALKVAPRPTSTPRPRSIPAFVVGERIAEVYEVKHIISKGGLNAVYLTHHHRWNTDVVVKVPNPELLAETEYIDATRAGAEKWISLGMHPHVAYCHYVHPLDDVPLLVVENLERGNLRAWLVQEQRPDLRAVLDLAIQLCHGLEHAHSRGVVHRAIKPENVLFASDGTVKLTDFGVATRVTAAAKSAATSGGPKAAPGTQPATLERKSASPYIAPEQWIDDDGADARTDIFAFGVCLYEMLCGRRPFDVARGPRREPPDPNSDGTETTLPGRLSKLLMRCVDWDRDRRPWSVTEIRQELAAIYSALFNEPSLFAELPEGSPEADGWNNRALSHLMLDQTGEADKAWEAALVADPKHLEGTYNYGLVRWRRGEITDQKLIEALQQARARRHEEWRAKYLLGLVQLERGEVEEATALLETAARLAPEEAEIHGVLQRVQAGDFDAARCLNVIEGHGGYVTSVAIGNDGRLAVSGSNDHSLRVWDVPTGRCLRVLEGHQQHVLSVAISGDARLALSGADDEPLRLWEVASGRCLRIFDGGAGRVYGVALCNDGRFGLSTGAHSERGFDVGAVQVWDTETGRRLHTFYGHSSAVKAVAITPDGRRALSGSDDRTARLWDVPSGRCLRVLEGHQHHVSAVATSPDGHWALTGGWDEVLRAWDLESGRCVQTFAGHTSLITAVHMLPDARRALSGSWDRSMRLWDMDTGRCLRTFEGHRGMVTSVHLLAGGRRALSASWDTTLRLWQTPESAAEICTLRASNPVRYNTTSS